MEDDTHICTTKSFVDQNFLSMYKFNIMLGLGLISLGAAAQPSEQEIYREFRRNGDTTPPRENIIITKKGNNREKMTIVVEGDEITVNGKPVDEFSGRQIEVRKTNGEVRILKVPELPRMPQMPRMPRMPRPAPVPSIAYRGNWNIQKGMLGVSVADSNGVYIRSVVPQSPADSAGLKKDDRLVSVNGVSVYSSDNFVQLINKMEPGAAVAIAYERNGRTRTVNAKLKSRRISGMLRGNGADWGDGLNMDMNMDMDHLEFSMDSGDPFPPARPNAPKMAIAFSRPRLGLNVEDLPVGNGVRIYETPEKDTEAAKAGLEMNDIITKLNGAPIKEVDSFRNDVSRIGAGETLTLEYERNKTVRTATLTVPKRIKKAGL